MESFTGQDSDFDAKIVDSLSSNDGCYDGNKNNLSHSKAKRRPALP